MESSLLAAEMVEANIIKPPISRTRRESTTEALSAPLIPGPGHTPQQHHKPPKSQPPISPKTSPGKPTLPPVGLLFEGYTDLNHAFLVDTNESDEDVEMTEEVRMPDSDEDGEPVEMQPSDEELVITPADTRRQNLPKINPSGEDPRLDLTSSRASEGLASSLTSCTIDDETTLCGCSMCYQPFSPDPLSNSVCHDFF